MSCFRFIPTIVLLALINSCPSVSAQNKSFDSSKYEHCPRNPNAFAPDSRVNATGTSEFHFDKAGRKINKDAWYMSLTFNETRLQSNEFVKYDSEVRDWFQGWLSVPEMVRGTVCLYKFSGVNASASGTGSNGCQGVLSPACISALRNVTQKNDESCSTFIATEEAKKHCGNGTIGTVFYSGPRWTASPMNLSNTTCTIQSPQKISIPDGYHSRPVFGFEPDHSDDNYSSFEWYDINVQQPIPFVITSILYPDRNSDEIQRDTQVLCVTPNAVVVGGRKPELQFKPREETKDEKLNNSEAAKLRFLGPVVIIVAVVVGLAFIF